MNGAIDIARQLAAIVLVVLAFAAAQRIARRCGHAPWANPVLGAAIIIIAVLAAADVPIVSFESHAAVLRWPLGMAIVALAAPVYREWPLIRRGAWRLLAVLTGGAIAGIATAVWAAKWLGLAPLLVHAVATKSVTSPFALAIHGALGGPAELAAGLSIATGIIGAMLLPPLLARLRLDDPRTLGLAVGQAAHVVGTDALLRRRPAAAPFAGLALAVAGVLTALLLPLVWRCLI
jgi:putative effector of murein hydrolase